MGVNLSDEYTATLVDWLRGKLAQVKRAHGTRVNTVLLPSVLWENLKNPMRLDGLKVIPFDNPEQSAQVQFGWTPEELKL